MVLSPLMQAPMLAAMYMAEEKILVITNDSRDYSQANLEENLMKIGLSKEDAERFVILGLEKIEGFQVRGAQFCCAIRCNSAQFGAILRRRLRLFQTSDVTAVNTLKRLELQGAVPSSATP
jgi:hypothetical protein